MASNPAISIRGLSKKFRLGQRERYRTIRDSLRSGLGKLARLGRGPKEADRGTFWALRDVSVDVAEGEVLGVIGRNGAGKSTLLKILSRITDPTEGEAILRGRVGSLLEVGTGFHPELSGRENIFLNGAILGMHRGEIDRKFDEIVAFAEVEKFLDTQVKHYSSGMYMRLAFAVAAHLEPEIMLVDEVLAVGDAAFQKKCLGKMGEVAKQGRTILFVSHNMNAVEDLCTKIVWLDQGRVRRHGSEVRETIKEYLFGDGDGGSATEWKNTEGRYDNPYFKPLRFSLVSDSGQLIQGAIRNDDEVYVEIEAEIAQVDPSLTIGYAIYTEAAELLYWSYQTDVAEEQWPKLDPGRNVIRSRLPSRLLNEGAYRIELIGGLHFRSWLFEPGSGVPSITVNVQGGLSDSPYWMARRPGLLGPVLPWGRR